MSRTKEKEGRFGVRLPSREQKFSEAQALSLTWLMILDPRRGRGKNDMGKKPYGWRDLVTPQNYSKAYSTATEQASLDCASWPC